MGRPKLFATSTPNLRRTTEKVGPNTLYYGDWKIGKKTYRPPLGPDFKEARRLLAKLMEDARLEALAAEAKAKSGNQGPFLLSELQRRSFEALDLHIEESTAKRYASSDRNALKGLGKAVPGVDENGNPLLPDILATELTKDAIEVWYAERARATSKTTANRDLVRLSQVLTHAADKGWAPAGLTSKIARYAEPEHRIRYLTEDEETALRAAIERTDPLTWRMIEFAFRTGLRQSEQLSLRWDQIVGNKIWLEADQTKNSRGRAVPTGKEIRRILDLQRGLHPVLVFPSGQGKVYGRESFRRWVWLPAFEAAGLEDFVWHDLRHTFCSRAVMRGMKLPTLMKIAGHKTYAMTLRYAHFAPEHLADEMEKIDV